MKKLKNSLTYSHQYNEPNIPTTHFNNHSMPILFHLYLHSLLSLHEIISNQVPDIISSWNTFIHELYTNSTSKIFFLIPSNIHKVHISLPVDYLIIFFILCLICIKLDQTNLHIIFGQYFSESLKLKFPPSPFFIFLPIIYERNWVICPVGFSVFWLIVPLWGYC